MWNTQGCSCRPTILLPKQKIVPYSNCKKNKLPRNYFAWLTNLSNFRKLIQILWIWASVDVGYLGHWLVGEQTGSGHVGGHGSGYVGVTCSRETRYFSFSFRWKSKISINNGRLRFSKYSLQVFAFCNSPAVVLRVQKKASALGLESTLQEMWAVSFSDTPYISFCSVRQLGLTEERET